MAAVRSEGGLLPADVLARISGLDRELGGLGAPAFHLAANERIGEAVARSWARLSAAWEAFCAERDLLPAGDHSSTATRERWLLPLFSELGYGRLVQQSGVEVDDKTYAVFCEYNHSPIHLVGAGVSLDRRTPGVRGAAEQSPHSLVQELLNRSTERLWGIVTNGLSLRLLRDNVTLTRQAYVAFDLEAIFATEAYEDFALLWLCAHQSRIEAPTPEECWLEQWTQAAQRDGTRALGELRLGVERAIEALGRGFLAQPANAALHSALRDGTLDGLAYYRELLRLVYRLLFLFVAEDRDALLLPADTTPQRHDARERYDAYYGTKRLRRLSMRRRGGRAHDLYEQIKLLCGWLYEAGQPVLALPPLGSALWNPDTTAHLSDARLGNEALLAAVRELSYVEGGRRPVDFRNLGAEELGSVYESLLELHPEIDRETASFSLTTAPGHERKQTGSYYTPTSLIGSLLETALDPVIAAAAAQDDPERALLDLTICDPACGSGHFLIAAANRIAKRLAAVREHDPEPSPELIRHALRDVVSRCIHGVDVNPMAVELCKVSLWLEALEPGRPLSFLDDRILHGNSLLGSTPALVEAGVPDDAYKPLLGDDRDVLKAWRQHNAKERKGQATLRLDGSDPVHDAAVLAELADRERAIADDSPEGVHAREAAYARITSCAEHDRLLLAADAWVAAFTTPKTLGAARITTGVVRRVVASGSAGLSAEELAAVRTETDAYRPLHWHVAFPAIFRSGTPNRGEHGWEGGFDCVLGNPPWERVKLQEKEFFASPAPEIAAAKNKAARDRMIVALETEQPALRAAFVAAKRRAEGESRLLRSTGHYPLCGRGDVNTYAVFAEGMRSVLAPNGRLGVIVPTGIATDDTTKHFFADLMERQSLVTLFSFWEARRFFEGKDDRSPFCLLTVAGSADCQPRPQFAFDVRAVSELEDPERRFELTAEDIALLNPNTRTCPTFRTRRDAEITKGIYRRVPVLVREGDPEGNPWGIKFSTMFHMSNDSHLFRTREELEADGFLLEGNVFVREDTHDDGSGGSRNAVGSTATGTGWATRFLPLYEAKMIHHFDHQWATYERDGTVRDVTREEKADPEFQVMPRYWVAEAEVDTQLGDWPHDWLLGWREVCRSTDERTAIGSLIPRTAVGHKYQLALVRDCAHAVGLSAVIASFVFDFVARQKMGGTAMSYFVMRQLPIPLPAALDRDLIAQATSLSSVFNPPAPDESGLGRAALDAAIFRLYGVTREEVDYIVDTFSVLRRKEEKRFGEYRTKRLVLDAYDAAVCSIDCFPSVS